MYALLYFKQITNKDLLYSTGNSAQYSVLTLMEKEFSFRMDWLDLLAVQGALKSFL